MKTPDESKCGMECIRTNAERICVKPEKGQCPRCEQLVSECLARIRQLESRLAQAEKERDAAVRDMSKAVRENGVCIACKHDKPFDNNCEENDFDCVNCISPCMCKSCHIGSNYEWRGPCPENTPDPAKE